MPTWLDTKTKLRILGALITAAALLVPQGIATKADTTSDKRANLQNQLAQLQTQINQYQNQINQTKKQQASLKGEITIYDAQINTLQLQIQANQTQQEDATLQIADLEDQITRRKAEIEDNKKILGQLIVQLNELDNNSFLAMSLGNSNFSAFLDQVQYNESVGGKVYQILQNIKQVKAQLEEQEADLKVKLDQLQKLHDQLNATQSSLDTQRQQKQGLLDQTKGQEKNYQKLLNKTSDQEAAVQQEINGLDGSVTPGHKIIPSKGVLAWPMDGVQTQGYGNTGFTALGYNFHNGIDLAGPPGQPIYAAADGTVVACDTGDAAYGNWCAIKHTLASGKIVTLYGHMRSFIVHGGQVVKQGDQIGYEGNTGNTTRLLYGPERGYHLHFTVFDADGFGISPGKYSSTQGHYTVPFGFTYNPLSFLGGK